MKELEQVNAKYAAQIDAMYEQFKRGKNFYAKEWIERLTKPDSENKLRICIWGAGQFGHDLYNRFLRLCGVNVSVFCDNDSQKWGIKLFGAIPIISPREIKPYYRVVIAVSGHEEEIYRECLDLGVPEENLFFASTSMITWATNYRCSTDNIFCEQMICGAKEVMTFFGDDYRSKDIVVKIMQRRLLDVSTPISQDGVQYFIPELSLRTDEAFVDAGAFNGDTLAEFVRCFPSDLSSEKVHYYAFECEKANCEEFRRHLKNMHCDFPVDLYPVALWDRKENLRFLGAGHNGLVDDSGEEIVSAAPLDKILDGKKISWIKMDIEGAEMRALAGCASIIKNQKPRLAICVYHNATDLYEIPKYIKSLRNDYQMLLRHHTTRDSETVLYAH